MRRLSVVALIAVVCAAAGVTVARRPRFTPAERGRRLAERTGCFACHGADGRAGAGNPGRTDRTVPGFGDEVMMYAKTRAEIREWIRDGVTARRAKSQTWRADRERGVLRMPAFRSRLNAGQIDDLAAFVAARAGMPEPDDSLAANGLERAHALGCTGCHGDGGRLGRGNPGSFKGYVPPWDGADFAELVRDSTEFGEWVGHGVSRRFAANPLAKVFLHRAVLRMPAYEHHLAGGDLGALWAYVKWLRGAGNSADSGRAEAAPAP